MRTFPGGHSPRLDRAERLSYGARTNLFADHEQMETRDLTPFDRHEAPCPLQESAAGTLISRRGLLRVGALTLAALVAERSPALAALRLGGPRRLRMLNTHTLERVDAVYFDGGRYIRSALEELNHLLRDHRTGEVFPVDPGVLDIAWGLARAVGKAGGEFEIISGYRSKATNDELWREGRNVAKNSLHCLGMAIDLRMPGVSLRRLRDAAIALGRGGVGYYPRPEFVHVDTGRIRCW